MNNIEVVNIYHKPNGNIPGYVEFFFETNLGILKYNITNLSFIKNVEWGGLVRIEEIDYLKKRYGALIMNEIRITYDSNMYILFTQKFILAIEYILTSYFDYNVPEFRFIEDIDGLNKTEFDEFKELDIVKIPAVDR